MSRQKFAIVILVAGKGKRMKNPEMAKVLYQLDGHPMIDYVVELALKLQSVKTVVVVGHQRKSVINHLTRTFPDQLQFVEQREQLGTGHAIIQVEETFKNFDGDLLILSGDVPLLRFSNVRKLIQDHWRTKSSATILTAEVENPAGYGRIIRNKKGLVQKIVEEKDADVKEKRVKEINSGIYVFDSVRVFEALKHITPDNKQREYYLTDVFEYFWKNRLRVSAFKARDFDEIRGINTHEQLREAEEVLQGRKLHALALF